jgi:hypothetical protein
VTRVTGTASERRGLTVVELAILSCAVAGSLGKVVDVVGNCPGGTGRIGGFLEH